MATWLVGFRERGADGRTVVGTSDIPAPSETAPLKMEKEGGNAEALAPALAPASAPPPSAVDQLIQAVAWPLASLANQTIYVPSTILAPMFGSAWASANQVAMAPIPTALEQVAASTAQFSNYPFTG